MYVDLVLIGFSFLGLVLVALGMKLGNNYLFHLGYPFSVVTLVISLLRIVACVP